MEKLHHIAAWHSSSLILDPSQFHVIRNLIFFFPENFQTVGCIATNMLTSSTSMLVVYSLLEFTEGLWWFDSACPQVYNYDVHAAMLGAVKNRSSLCFNDGVIFLFGTENGQYTYANTDTG